MVAAAHPSNLVYQYFITSHRSHRQMFSVFVFLISWGSSITTCSPSLTNVTIEKAEINKKIGGQSDQNYLGSLTSAMDLFLLKAQRIMYTMQGRIDGLKRQVDKVRFDIQRVQNMSAENDRFCLSQLNSSKGAWCSCANVTKNDGSGPTSETMWLIDPRTNVPNFGDMISRPMARFYSAAVQSDPANQPARQFEDFNPAGDLNPECLTLQNLAKQVETVTLFNGSCIRVYKGTSCGGRSLALYPKIMGAGQMNTDGDDDDESMEKDYIISINHLADDGEKEILGFVGSVRGCFENELDDSLYQLTSNDDDFVEDDVVTRFKKLEKVTTLGFLVPDIVFMGFPASYRSTYDLPLRHYKIGYGGRMEFIQARLTLENVRLDGREPEMEMTQNLVNYYSKLAANGGSTNDSMGYFLSHVNFKVQSLPYDIFQVFPQSRQNHGLLMEQERKILAYFSQAQNSGKKLDVFVNVDYEKVDGLRPTGFTYRVHFLEDKLMHDYYLPNVVQ